MSYELRPREAPAQPVDIAAQRLQVVAQSRRGMLDAVRQALADAARTMGSLERCQATIHPQTVRHGASPRFEIRVSVTRRNGGEPSAQ